MSHSQHSIITKTKEIEERNQRLRKIAREVTSIICCSNNVTEDEAFVLGVVNKLKEINEPLYCIKWAIDGGKINFGIGLRMAHSIEWSSAQIRVVVRTNHSSDEPSQVTSPVSGSEEHDHFLTS